jgi:hypothetical protein
MVELETVLQFITTIAQEHPGKSTYELVNILRGYTKAAYTSPMWTAATGYEQHYWPGERQGQLNRDVPICGEVTDFGHFIAALSDQINQPGLKLSDLTRWTADHTSWAGDVGSAIATFRGQSQPLQIPTIKAALARFASDPDQAANTAAVVIGAMANAAPQTAIAQLIQQYAAIPYSSHIQTLIKLRFAGIITGNQLQNPAKVEAEIRRAVFRYLELSPDSTLAQALKSLISLKPKLDVTQRVATIGGDLLEGSLYFLDYLVKKGNLAPLTFKPYQLPQVPWLGTVNYTVTVGNL